MYTETCDCMKSFEKETAESARKALRMHQLSCKHSEKAKEMESAIEEAVPETKTETTKMLTSEQQAIAERVTAQDTDWFTIREDELEDFSLMVNPYDLPPEAAKMQKEKQFAFRFCEKKPERIDYLTRSQRPPLRWAIVNKVNMPVLGHLVDEMHGGVCVGDQIMLFKPWWMHQKVKDEKQRMAEGQDNSGTLEAKQRQLDNPGEGIEAYTGRSHRIGSSDQVLESESAFDDAGNLVGAE